MFFLRDLNFANLNMACHFVLVATFAYLTYMTSSARTYVCVSVPRKRFEETLEVIIIKHGTVTASGMGMHLMFIIVTLAFFQGHTYLNHDNDKCSIISETVQAIPIKFGCEDNAIKGQYNCCLSVQHAQTLNYFTDRTINQHIHSNQTCMFTCIPNTTFLLGSLYLFLTQSINTLLN